MKAGGISKLGDMSKLDINSRLLTVAYNSRQGQFRHQYHESSFLGKRLQVNKISDGTKTQTPVPCICMPSTAIGYRVLVPSPILSATMSYILLD